MVIKNYKILLTMFTGQMMLINIPDASSYYSGRHLDLSFLICLHRTDGPTHFNKHRICLMKGKRRDGGGTERIVNSCTRYKFNSNCPYYFSQCPGP